ncbi:isoprenylcysteine carboxylmethyltransferase family protein [Rhodopseudomonas palustris]|uniref:Isoprenylcysteine carboxyl methyltransferase n=1 Tax=Rhodopseudomonas palustris (strain BisB5) TaxID=316057 RepID=Q130T6_RHOPS|nr:Isoprenylcysteine carboxyl methyltransferase [Rhodopseudomonas palustris BisB5]MBB1090235.1 isoprenylcysteine carboxylmethyltransferase family protein [Rhodopseudomonas palustris]
MSVSDKTRPNVLPWPPMLLGIAALASIGLGWLAPLPAPSARWVSLLGGALALLGLALDVWAILTMRSAKTNILPHRAADRLVTWGPFGFSRNPIYLANTWLLAGIGLAFGNAWFIVFALLSALAVDRLAIRREERHLAIRFGNDWIAYAAQTPRWLIR